MIADFIELGHGSHFLIRRININAVVFVIAQQLATHFLQIKH